jgi:hypothetical protein
MQKFAPLRVLYVGMEIWREKLFLADVKVGREGSSEPQTCVKYEIPKSSPWSKNAFVCAGNLTLAVSM